MSFALFVSCSEDESIREISPDISEFPESELISFNEIDELTQSTIEGELQDEEETTVNGRTASTGIGIERRFYDFTADVVSGPDAGLMLEGNLNTRFTFYHALFTVIRGRFVLPSGERGKVRGAIVSDGIVYLIFEVPNLGIVHGIGEVDENGNLEGTFSFIGTENSGTWSAELTRTVVPNKNIVEIIEGDGRFKTLVSALESTELTTALNQSGPFTLFAPTDEAFAKLESVPDGETLTNILLYHVLPQSLNTTRLLRREIITTLLAEDVKVSLDADNNIVINDQVKLLQANIRGTNGIIQIIDAVLIPPSLVPQESIVDIAVSEPELSTLVGALQAADLVETLQGEGPFTVFAPTNAAFAALDAIPEGEALAEVLLYHVAGGKFTADDLLEKQTVTTVQGQDVTIQLVDGEVILNGNIKVTTANIEASNGIIHIIDGVLLPPTEPSGSIVDIALADPNLSTLVDALQTADLVETLQGEGKFTVFAPTNAAFAALDVIPEGNILKEVLLYHVLSGEFDSEALRTNAIQETLQGNTIQAGQDTQGTRLFINGIEVITADIQATNGIIHVIEGVLIPPSFNNPGTIVEVAQRTPELSSLVSALQQADLIDALNGTEEFTVVAPTNAAFEAIGALPETDVLRDILLLHVAPGSFSFEELVEGDGRVLRSLQGRLLRFTAANTNSSNGADRVSVVASTSSARIIIKNVPANNGIVHVIDAVLLP